MKTEHKVMSLAMALGLFFWVADTILDHLFFYHQPFVELLITRVPPHELYIRSVAIIGFIVFGQIAAKIVARREHAERQLQLAHEELEQRVSLRTASLAKACGQLKALVRKRRTVEKALRENETRFHQMFDKSLAVKLLIDPRTGIVADANPAACKYYGYPLETLKTMRISDINTLPPDRVLGEMALAEEEKRNHFFFKHRLSSGEIREVEEFSCVIDFGDQKLLYSIINDITERKRAEDALRDSAERYRTLFNNTNDAIFVRILEDRNMAAKFTEVNDVACEILGYSRNELLTMSPVDIAAPEEYVNLPTIMERILTEKHVIYNVTLRNKAGQSIPVELSAHLFDFRGQPTVLTVARDITERRKGEEALRQSKACLQSLSSQLMNAQERERALIARELHDSIGQTLSAIKFRVETALFQAEDQHVSSGLKTLENIVPIVQHAIEEIRRICTDLRPSMLDDLGIVATIHWFCRQFHSTYPRIKIEKHVDIREEEISDQQKTVVFRVMQEALHNVAKHSDADLVRLSFEKTNQEIRLTISDNGKGFDLQQALDRRGVMGGMGLASMKERTELAEGSFTIESILHEGTTIRASWPCTPGS